LNGVEIKREKRDRTIQKIATKEEDLRDIKKRIDNEKAQRKEAQRKVANQQVNNPQAPQQEIITPNNILFVENLTANITDFMLKNLFSQYTGFR